MAGWLLVANITPSLLGWVLSCVVTTDLLGSFIKQANKEAQMKIWLRQIRFLALEYIVATQDLPQPRHRRRRHRRRPSHATVRLGHISELRVQTIDLCR